MSTKKARRLTIFEGIFGALYVGLSLLSPFLRYRRIRWGTTKEEFYRKLPGDELVPAPRWLYTHAITIKSSPEKVWPWLVQIGVGKAGFYRY